VDTDDRTVLDHLDEEYLLWLLRRLVQIPSINPPGHLAPIAHFVAEEMRAQGLQVEIAGDAGTGWERPNVLAILPGDTAAWGVLFSAHTDVVPAYDLHLWSHDPFAAAVVDGVVFGRGTADCKGSLAAMMAAVRAVAQARPPLSRSLALLAWAGDEWHPPDARWFNGETYMAMNGHLHPAPYVGQPADTERRGRLHGRGAEGPGAGLLRGWCAGHRLPAGAPLGRGVPLQGDAQQLRAR